MPAPNTDAATTANGLPFTAGNCFARWTSGRRPGLAMLGLALLVLGGCASVNHAALDRTRLHTPVKVLVIQSPMSVSAKRMQSVFAPKHKKPLTLASPELVPVVAHAQSRALTDMQATLDTYPKLAIVKPPAKAGPLLARIQQQQYTNPISPAQARQLQAETGADVILRFGITDYGLTPTTWRTSYITFEVVTTLAITAIIASVGSTVAKGAAGAYLAQETVEEIAEGYAGFWALNVVCRPVRIVAQLIQPKPFAVVWRDSDTGLSNVQFSRLYREISTDERDRQLGQSTDFAIKDLVTALTDKLSGKTMLHRPAKLKWEM